MSESAPTFAMQGDTLFIPEYNKLSLFDMSNPASPTPISTLPLPGQTISPISIRPNGEKVLILMRCSSNTSNFGDQCYYVVDAAQPSKPALIGTYRHSPVFMNSLYKTLDDQPTWAVMRWDGHRVFVSNEWGGIFTMDLTDPAKPKALTEYWTPMPARGIFVSERYLTTFTIADFPYPAPVDARDQVIEMCK
jgi:hypothetical protein